MHATTWCDVEPTIDDAKHAIDPALATDSEDKMKVWAYLMTQYNLKPGLRKFGREGEKAAMKRIDTAARNGHVDCNGPVKFEPRRSNAGAHLTTLSERKTNRKNKGMSVHQRSPATELHSQGRCGITNGVNRINLHHSSDCSI